MKNFLFSSLSILLCTLGVCMSENVEITHQLTQYTLSNFNSMPEIDSVECNTDADCYSNSCVEGVCKYYFLCPEDENQKCVSIPSEAWKTYDSREPNNVHPETYRPILRSCYKEELHTAFLAKLLAPNCDTQVCEKDNDCLFGTCYNSTCITETPIYKCNSEDKVCKKANFIKCKFDNECFSDHCISGFCIENPYPSLKKGVVRSFITAIAIRLFKSLVKFFYGGAKKHRANRDDKPLRKQSKKENHDTKEE